MIRSVAWDSGWSATVSVNGGKAQTIPVKDFDLVQQVHIPAGDDVVSFHYRPPHLLLASVLSWARSCSWWCCSVSGWSAGAGGRESGPEPAADMRRTWRRKSSPEVVPERVG